MRKLIITVTAILCLTAFASAYGGDFQYGVKLGSTLSSIRMTDRVYNHIDPDKPDIWFHYFTHKLGLSFGAFGGLYVSESIYLGIEPGYVIKGANFSDGNAKLNLSYLNLPVIVKYKVSDRIGILAGPEFSTPVTATLDYNGLEIDMKEFYDTGMETSVLLGVEYEATDQFALGLRYSYGLTKISETIWYDETGEVLGAVKEFNEYLLFYLALGFAG